LSLAGRDEIEGLGNQKVERWGRRRKRIGATALESQGQSVGYETSLPAQGGALVGILLLSNVAFNLTDLATTFVALGSGLGEGNSLLLAMSAATGLGVFGSLAILKVVILAGAAAVALVGARSASNATRKLAVCYLLTSTMIFYIVSLNNVYWILH
jgi:hypothetical protein